MRAVVGGVFLLPSNSSATALPPFPTQNLIPFSLKSHQAATNLPFSFLPRKTRTGLSISVSSKHKTNSNIGTGNATGDGYGEEKMMLMMPFDEMRDWFMNKPAGFGEGKTYDTSMEEKLMEEIEQSRKAQLANINKLKNAAAGTSNKKPEQLVQKETEVVPNGIRVRVGNLPKKKNIRRDLQLAFKGFPGLVNISPAVSGNKKTRDPVCKGFAFLYFESEETAYRFVQMYSKQSIRFGKIQKQITCEITDPQNSSKEMVVATSLSAQPRFPGMGDEIDADSDVDSLSWDSQEGTFSEEESEITFFGGNEDSMGIVYNMEDEHVFSGWENVEVDAELVGVTEPNNKENKKPKKVGSVAAKRRSGNGGARKQQMVKDKSDKVLRLEVPGSAKRLKIKERAVLTGVFSKYGGKANMGASS